MCQDVAAGLRAARSLCGEQPGRLKGGLRCPSPETSICTQHPRARALPGWTARTCPHLCRGRLAKEKEGPGPGLCAQLSPWLQVTDETCPWVPRRWRHHPCPFQKSQLPSDSLGGPAWPGTHSDVFPGTRQPLLGARSPGREPS